MVQYQFDLYVNRVV